MFDWIVQHSIPLVLFVIVLHFFLAGLGFKGLLSWLDRTGVVKKKE